MLSASPAAAVRLPRLAPALCRALPASDAAPASGCRGPRLPAGGRHEPSITRRNCCALGSGRYGLICERSENVLCCEGVATKAVTGCRDLWRALTVWPRLWRQRALLC